MSIRTSLLFQLGVTEIISLLVFGLSQGYWLLGLLAPIWALFLPFGVIMSFNDPISKQLIIPAVFVVASIFIILFSVFNKLHRLWGNVFLFFLNLISIITILGLE